MDIPSVLVLDQTVDEMPPFLSLLSTSENNIFMSSNDSIIFYTFLILAIFQIWILREWFTPQIAGEFLSFN